MRSAGDRAAVGLDGHRARGVPRLVEAASSGVVERRLVEATLPPALTRCTCTSTSCLATLNAVATTNCPLGKNAAAPPCELAVMAAGVTLEAAWPDGLNSA